MRLSALRPGQVLRATQVVVTPGGKGLNVGRTARALGRSAVLVGLVPGRLGATAAQMIAEEGVTLRGVPCGGEIRSTAVLLEDDGRITVINEPGPPLDASGWARYEREIESGLQQGASALVCSGSCPPGTPGDAYARLVSLARAHGALGVVDATGELLARSLEAGADVVTPNLGEAEGLLFGTEGEPMDAAANASERAVKAARGLHERGAGTAVVTAADAGVAVVNGSGAWWAPAVPVRARNTVGAGDAFVTAFTLTLVDGQPLDAAIREGIATAAASVETEVGGMVDAARARQLRSDVPPLQPA